MFGMKHSLCFTSIVSNAQPSESMPTRKSCCGSRSNIVRGSAGARDAAAKSIVENLPSVRHDALDLIVAPATGGRGMVGGHLAFAIDQHGHVGLSVAVTVSRAGLVRLG